MLRSSQRQLQTVLSVNLTMLRPLGNCPCGTANTARPSIEADGASNRPVVFSNTSFPELEQSRIYHEWLSTVSLHKPLKHSLTGPADADKPHNVVCSQCHLPENLIHCGTCCRSYHTWCDPSMARRAGTGDFHCPSCVDKGWDRAPPQFTRPASTSSDSRATTPVGNPSRILPSMSGEGSVGTRESPLATRHSSPGYSSASCASERPQGFDHASTGENLPLISQMYPHVLAYMAQTDGQTELPLRQPELMHRLGLMMKEVESHRSLLGKMAILREEFDRIQTENVQIRTYLNSRLPSLEPRLASPSAFSSIPRPSADTTGKSWDSIILDLI